MYNPQHASVFFPPPPPPNDKKIEREVFVCHLGRQMILSYIMQPFNVWFWGTMCCLMKDATIFSLQNFWMHL